ncbi:helix-turn-helix domain-containing protein [Bacillus sp. UNC438CL73TsuS30]|uniref:helix-turn-helix domain-containing protein n=1 Tax=Bacillus sp. UNC438CL73TsuS30 TaxID=1340434 RepID=UPI00047A7DAD|nr:helix-turn-helix domain-containing protein [Bacillus sp. UNC438CL73TsuS30]
MKNQHLYTFLCKKFNPMPFQIYFFKNRKQSPQLLYTNNETTPNHFTMLLASVTDTISIQFDGNQTAVSFYYSEHNQVLLTLSSPNVNLSEQELEHLHVMFSFLATENTLREKEAELASMIESSLTITSSLELEEVLNKIITQALSVIPAADKGYLQLYDEKTNELIPRAAVGYNEKLQAVKIKSGESITGKVFQDRTPVMYESPSEVFKEMKTITKGNLTIFQKSIDFLQIKSMIAIPLILENKAIGVMAVQQFNTEGKLRERDFSLLQGFAAQAAIAIQNAKLFQEKNARLAEITNLTRELEDKNKLLLRRAEIHETLTQLSLQNKSVEFIILELNRMMNSEIFFFDHLDMELFPKKNIPSSYLSNDEFSKILRTRKRPFLMKIVDGSEIEYYVYPIQSDRVTLGCFFVPLREPISQQDKMTIEQASSVLALELTKRKTQAEVYYKKTHELYNELLQYKDPSALKEIGELLGLNSQSHFSVIFVEVVAYQDLQTLEAVIHRLISQLKRRISSQGTLIFGFHNKVTILFSTQHTHEINEWVHSLHSLLVKWSDREEMPLYAGLSTPQEGIQSIVKCHEEANKSLAYLISRKQTGMMDYKKMGINRLFPTGSSPEIERFAEEILAPLRTEKARNNDLEKTLMTYVKCNKSMIETADTLHIHKNTLYNRIKKIEELLGLEFHNPEDYLQILLACHFQEDLLLSRRNIGALIE